MTAEPFGICPTCEKEYYSRLGCEHWHDNASSPRLAPGHRRRRRDEVKTLLEDQFSTMIGTMREISNGLAALAGVQIIVSGMVKDALPISVHTIPPINILTYGFAFIKETTELMDELGWKPWKPRKPINRDRVADEFADILAFLGLLTLYVMRLTGLTTDDLAQAYMRKSDVNVARFSGEVEDYKPAPVPMADSTRG